MSKTKNGIPEEFKLNKSRLTYEEILDYKKIGIPDFRQNYLELFSSDVLEDLTTIMEWSSDNQLKSRKMIEYLSDFGFEDLGLGTNILTVTNPLYPGVVFKLALDYYGVADNINDEWLSETIPHYAKFITRDLTGIVSVQQRYTVIKSLARLNTFREEILTLLNKLSKKYLVIDLGLNRFLNYGVDRDGEFIIVDGSDLYPVSNAKTLMVCSRGVGYKGNSHKVKRCGGHLEYDEDFHELVCQKCGARCNPSELRPTKGDGDMAAMFITDGLSNNERFELEKEGILKILKRKNASNTPSLADEMRKYECPDDPDEDDDDFVDPADLDDVDDDENVEDIDELISKKIQSIAKAEGEKFDADVTEAKNDKPTVDVSDTEDEDDDESDFEIHSRREDEPQETIDITKVPKMTIDGDDEHTVRFFKDDDPKPTDEQMSEPGIRYEIRDDSLYITSSGDFDTNWLDNGLPIIVSFDGGKEYTLLARSDQVKEFIDASIRDAKEDQRL